RRRRPSRRSPALAPAVPPTRPTLRSGSRDLTAGVGIAPRPPLPLSQADYRRVNSRLRQDRAGVWGARRADVDRTWLGGLVVVLLQAFQPVPAVAQQVRSGGEETITIRGFISATLFVNDQLFALSNGQSAIWAEFPELERDAYYHGGDVRNTRLGLDFNGPAVFGDWRARGTLEGDFFGGFVGTGAFSDEQPQLRLRLAYADLTDGRTTVRLGQYWAPVFGYIPESLSHIAFPLGWGGGGLIGWRFPGLFIYHDLTPDRPTRVEIQFAALRGSWSDEPVLDDVSAGEATLAPQLELRLDFGRRPATGTQWGAFLAGHWDHKDLSGPGD